MRTLIIIYWIFAIGRIFLCLINFYLSKMLIEQKKKYNENKRDIERLLKVLNENNSLESKLNSYECRRKAWINAEKLNY